MPEYPFSEAQLQELHKRFTYHPPHGNQTERYTLLRSAAHELAKCILNATPASREQSIAMTKLEESVMWANAAIARNEQEPAPVPDAKPQG